MTVTIEDGEGYMGRFWDEFGQIRKWSRIRLGQDPVDTEDFYAMRLTPARLNLDDVDHIVEILRSSEGGDGSAPRIFLHSVELEAVESLRSLSHRDVFQVELIQENPKVWMSLGRWAEVATPDVNDEEARRIVREVHSFVESRPNKGFDEGLGWTTMAIMAILASQAISAVVTLDWRHGIAALFMWLLLAVVGAVWRNKPIEVVARRYEDERQADHERRTSKLQYRREVKLLVLGVIAGNLTAGPLQDYVLELLRSHIP